MDKKNRSFTCLPLVLLTLLGPLAVVMIALIAVRFAIPFVVFGVVGYVLLTSYFYIFTHNAFSVIRIDEAGLHNAYFSVAWENIESFQYFHLDLSKYRWPKFKPLTTILAVGECGKGGFWFQKRQKCIMLSLTKKNIALLAKYGAEKSEQIREVLIDYPVAENQR